MVKVTPEPQSQEAEEAVLGSILIDPDALMAVLQTGLSSSDFWNPYRGAIYDTMLKMNDKLEAIDFLTLRSALEARKNGDGRSILEHVNGDGYLTELIARTPTAIHAAHYANIVREKAARRNVIAAAGKIAERAYNNEANTEQIYAEAGSILAEATKTEAPHTHHEGGAEALLQFLERQQEIADRRASGTYRVLDTPWVDVNQILEEFPAGEISIVAAKTSVGKTIWMQNVAEYNAQRGFKIAYYHLENPVASLEMRMIARHSKISYKELKAGYNGPLIAEAIDSISRWYGNMTYINACGWSASRVVADVQRLHAQGKCDFVFLDYFSLLALPDNSGHNDTKSLALEFGKLKDCCTRLGISFEVAVQLNRQANMTEGERPQLRQLRDCGELEERANQVVFLHRPNKRPEQTQTGSVEPLEVIVAKNTNGALGVAKIGHVLGQFKLVNLQR